MYTVHTTYRRFDVNAGEVRAFCQTDKINAPTKEIAKANAWKLILGEYPYAQFESQSARLAKHP